MAQSTWVNISPDWTEYVEARVEALVEENAKLKKRIAQLEAIEMDSAHGVVLEPVSSVLVQPLSLRAQ